MTDIIVADSLPTRKIVHTCPNGQTFSYTITTLTEGCYLLEAEHTHEVRQFGSPEALNGFMKALRAHLDAKYPIDEIAARRAAKNDIQYRQREMMQRTGAATPNQAHAVLMSAYLAGK